MTTPPDPLPPSRRGLTAPPPPPAANGAGARADRTREYVAAYGDGTGLASYLKSLPTYVDDVERDYPYIYDEMLKDEVVSASVKTVVYSVLQEGVELRPALDDEDDPDYATAKRHVDEAEAAFDYFDVDVEDLCRELLYSLCLGWLAAEKTVATLEGGKYDGLDCWESVRVKPRRNTSPVVTPTNRLAGYLCRVVGRPWGQSQGMVVGDVRKHPNYVPREKFVHAAWDGRECDPRGRSILRPVYRRWYEKIQTCGDWLKHLAQFGSPWVVGTTAPGSDSAAVVDALGNPTGAAGVLSPEQEFLNKLVQFRNGGAIAVPSGWTVQLLQAASAGDAFVKKVDSCDRAIEKGVTLQNLATSEGEHQARAAAQVHQDTLGLLPGAVRRWLCRLLQRQLLRPFVAMNHGPDAARLAPRLGLEKVAQEDRAKMLAAWASVGWKVAPSQTPAVDEELGLEPRTPEEAQPPPPVPTPGMPGRPGAAPPGGNGPGAGKGEAPFAFDPDEPR
jgi:hypothetical protein